ncbi:MAG: band 7 protein [Myxococcales bacterium]|nr:band 7 protein [Myxococcales bacterium]
MAEVRNFIVVRHLRSELSQFVLAHRGGRLVRSGRGVSFWYFPLSTSIAEVPMDDRELPFMFHGKSSDFQDVTAQGVITFRVVDPKNLAERVDFSVDLATGAWVARPLDVLATLLTGLAEQLALGTLAASPIPELCAEGAPRVREVVQAGLLDDAGVRDMGLEVVTVRVSAVQSTAELQRALEAPARERIQQQADDAGFERRARAVDKERAIQENELANRIELARREEELIRQSGLNERRRKEEDVLAKRVDAEGAAERARIRAAADAEGIRVVESAKVASERERMDVFRTLPPSVIVSLAAQSLAQKIESIDHVNITPELFGPLITDLLRAGTARLDAGK